MTVDRVDDLRRRGYYCRVIAHRGYSSAFPENTLQAFERAFSAGADLAELDLRLSRDGMLVCHHDVTIGDVDVSGLLAEDLGKHNVAMLADVLPRLRGSAGLLFDLKIATPDFTDMVLATICCHSMVKQVVVGVRSIEQASQVRRASAETVILGFLRDYSTFPEFYAVGGNIARVWEEDCSAEQVLLARCGDHPVWVTAGRKSLHERPGDIDAARLRQLFDLGIDGVLVNDPALAYRVRPVIPASFGAAKTCH